MATKQVTPEYIKNEAVTPDTRRESKDLDSSFVTEVLPTSHKIVLDRVFQTSDATVLKWYYELAHRGKFGDRLAHLIALDAYGKIPHTSNVAELSMEEKMDQIVTTVSQITNMLIRNQRMTESSMSSQAKSIKFLQSVALTVKSQGEILSAIESVMVSENTYSPEEIKTVLNGIKQAMRELHPVQPVNK